MHLFFSVILVRLTMYQKNILLKCSVKFNLSTYYIEIQLTNY